MSPRALQLLGRHYTTLGPLAIAELPDGGAVALSRGVLRKSYRYVDPNEDAVLLLRTERGSLLAVADGYNGAAASELALAHIGRCGPELILTASERFRGRMEQLVIDISHDLRGHEPSRSCLLVAVLTGRECRWLCLGDSSMFRSSVPDALTPSNDLVLAPGLRGLPNPPEFWSGSYTLEPGERLALVSDGVTNFVKDTTSIPRMLHEAESDAQAARDLAYAAMRGGAGDNIGIATIRVT